MKRVVIALLIVGCGGGMQGTSGSECSKDTDCKGSRVCSNGACVDPAGGGSAGGGATNNGTAGGSGSHGGTAGGLGGFGTAGGSGTGGNTQCFTGKDSECPNGSWCNMKQCVATTKARVSEMCTNNTDCAGGACLYRNQNDVAGYCSKRCESFSECPSFWDCDNIANAAGKYCIQN